MIQIEVLAAGLFLAVVIGAVTLWRTTITAGFVEKIHHETGTLARQLKLDEEAQARALKELAAEVAREVARVLVEKQAGVARVLVEKQAEDGDE
jgi:hypothetical protein